MIGKEAAVKLTDMGEIAKFCLAAPSFTFPTGSRCVFGIEPQTILGTEGFMPPTPPLEVPQTVARSNSQAVQILLMNGRASKTKNNPTAVINYYIHITLAAGDTTKPFILEPGRDVPLTSRNWKDSWHGPHNSWLAPSREMRAAIGGPFCSGNTCAPLDAHLWQFLAAMKLKQSQLPTKLCGAQSGKCR